MKHRDCSPDMQTGPFIEAIETECPYCHGTHVEYLSFDANENGMQETYKCFDCDVEFSIDVEIPF